jgi:hypothetical protein
MNNLNNFIDISEIGIGKFQYEIEKIDLSEVISEIVSILETQLKLKNL